MPNPITAVMIYVPNVTQALVWYQRAFPESVLENVNSHAFQYLNCGGVRLELVQADTKVQSGAAGSIV